MKKLLTSEVGAIVLWAVGSLVGAAILAPWFYIWGKQLADACATRELPGVVEWLGAACDRAKLGRFYARAMLLCALAMMPLLVRRIRMLGRSKGAPKIIQLDTLGARTATIHFVVSFAVAGAILWLAGLGLARAGAFVADAAPVKPSKLLTNCALPAVGASFIEEWVFRGLLLGLWLRVSRPVSACIGSSLLFSFLHFLKPPVEVGDPTHPLAGFDLLRHILLHFAEPQFFITEFATLTVVGLILCWTRVRTRSLWFPIGLHAGWVFAFSAFNLLYNYAHHPLHPWGVGLTLRSGIIPLLALALTAAACHLVLKWLERPVAQRP